ncbi:hypothetical protein CBL_14351 [Carabus blaptoides fortunei]
MDKRLVGMIFRSGDLSPAQVAKQENQLTLVQVRYLSDAETVCVQARPPLENKNITQWPLWSIVLLNANSYDCGARCSQQVAVMHSLTTDSGTSMSGVIEVMPCVHRELTEDATSNLLIVWPFLHLATREHDEYQARTGGCANPVRCALTVSTGVF